MHLHVHTHNSIGKDMSLQSDHGMTAGVVLRLVDPIRDLGHHLYVDNLYTSPSLFRELHLRGFEACGTLRINRRGVPPEVKTALKKGEKRVVPVDDNMAVIQWHDKRLVSILSTLHSDSPVETERRSRSAPGGREVVEKPEAVVEYNMYMGGIDHGYQLLSYYGFPHRTVKWWRRAFFFLLEAAIVNSYIMYSMGVSGPRLSHKQFRISQAKQLLASTAQGELVASQGPVHQPHQPLARLMERHFPAQLEKSSAGVQL